MWYKDIKKPILALAPMVEPTLREGWGENLNFTL